MAKLSLNAAQKKCLEFYANGDFEHLADIESEFQFKESLNDCGDGLLRFLMNELASSEDCDSLETAMQRLDSAIEDIRAVQRNVSLISDDVAWESERELQKKDSRPIAGHPKLFIEALGYNIDEDSQQPGLWLWTAPSDGCDSSFHTAQEALNSAWLDAVGQTMGLNNLSSAQWDAMTFGEQKTAILQALSEEGDDAQGVVERAPNSEQAPA